MIHQQGSEYKDSTQIEEAVEETAPKRKWKVAAWILGAVLILLLVFFLIVFFSKGSKSDPTPDPTPSNDIVVGDDAYWDQFDTFSYTAEERAQLRAWGYTGDEIETNEANETPAADLIAESKQAQEEARATLSNPESPEYQALLNSTWLGQQAITFPEFVEGVTEGEVSYNTYTLNADYDKVPAHGHNLYLKVYMEDGSYSFMECPLLRYMQLADSGNIVVQYQTATINGVTIIYSMKEVTVQ